MTDDDIARDRATIAKATSEPWRVDIATKDTLCVLDEHGGWVAETGARSCADFIAAARTRWPAALGEVERLRGESRRLRAQVDALREVERAARYCVASWGERDADEDSFSCDLRDALARLDALRAGEETP